MHLATVLADFAIGFFAVKLSTNVYQSLASVRQWLGSGQAINLVGGIQSTALSALNRQNRLPMTVFMVRKWSFFVVDCPNRIEY